MSDLHETDDAAAFARDLRTLRHDAGHPTLGRIERSSQVSKSVVSEAFAGKRLPSARTVRGIVATCGGDVGAWLTRRDAIAASASAAATSVPSATAPTGEVPAASTPPASAPTVHRTVRLGVAIVAVAAALLIGVVGTLAVQAGSRPPAAASAATGSEGADPTPSVVPPQIAVTTGVDPADTKCVDDAETATSETGRDGTLLEIIYSAKCHAAWSRVTRYDGRSTGNEVSTSIYRQIAPKASDRQSTVEPDSQSAYTTLIVRPTPETKLCAVGSITVSGKTIDFGKPICL